MACLIFSYIQLNIRYGNVYLNSLKDELNPICHLLALLVHHILHVSRIRVNMLISQPVHTATLYKGFYVFLKIFWPEGDPLQSKHVATVNNTKYFNFVDTILIFNFIVKN